MVATHNAGKLREMRELLAPHGIEAVLRRGIGIERAGRDRRHFCANARIKAMAAAHAAQLPAFAMILVLWWTRSMARRASTRPAGPGSPNTSSAP